MTDRVLVLDLETVRDLGAAARVLGLVGQSDEAVRLALGTEFPKLPLHRIACIGSLVASRGDDGWRVEAVGAPHIGEQSEQELITAFVKKISALKPLLVTFNGATFDLPVLRYRAMVHRISGAGLTARNYFARETDAATDLCETLASFDQRAKVKLDLLCKTLGFTGKPGGIDGSQVDSYVADGRIAEVAAYCETDVVNTYRVWLTYELFEGRLSREAWVASEDNLRDFIFAQLPDKPHLRALVCGAVEPAPGALGNVPDIAASQPAKALPSAPVPGNTITWRVLLNIVRDYSFRAWQRL
jgi:predicted PolB exonuclease-like 3'-5' exonuclease